MLKPFSLSLCLCCDSFQGLGVMSSSEKGMGTPYPTDARCALAGVQITCIQLTSHCTAALVLDPYKSNYLLARIVIVQPLQQLSVKPKSEHVSRACPQPASLGKTDQLDSNILAEVKHLSQESPGSVQEQSKLQAFCYSNSRKGSQKGSFMGHPRH